MTHTPGPWEIVLEGNDHVIRGERYFVAEIIGIDGYQEYDNARLIAAAPEMLAALKAVRDHLQRASFDYSNGATDPLGQFDEGNVYGWKAHNELVAQLEAAIAKAEGQP